MAHKYEEELEILKERICRDVRESIRYFLKNRPEKNIPYEVLLKNQFAEACEDIAKRVLNMANNLHYKAMNVEPDRKETLWKDIEKWVEKNCKCGLKESGVWSEEVFDRYGCNCYPKTLGVEMKKTYVITYTDEIEATCAEDAYRVLLDMLSSDVQFQDISAFEIREKELLEISI